MQVAIAKRALNDDPYCGDECGYWKTGNKTVLCVADGLGHGEHAESAARAAMQYVGNHLSQSLDELFAGCNQALRNTRGVVMSTAIIDEDTGTLAYAGIGNTRAMIVGEPRAKNIDGRTIILSSDYGIVGGGYKTLSPETVPLIAGDLVILYTDGVEEMIGVSRYDDALRADLQRLAERIIQDWGREADDAAVLIFRYKGEGAQ